MKDPALLHLLRQAAQTTGLVILTDSDGAGFLIRNTLKSALPEQGVLHAYIPDLPGKERRKAVPGKEGASRRRGMTPEILLKALRNAGAEFEDGSAPSSAKTPITKQDLFVLGLSGRSGKHKEARRASIRATPSLPAPASAKCAAAGAERPVFPRQFFSQAHHILDRSGNARPACGRSAPFKDYLHFYKVSTCSVTPHKTDFPDIRCPAAAAAAAGLFSGFLSGKGLAVFFRFPSWQ